MDTRHGTVGCHYACPAITTTLFQFLSELRSIILLYPSFSYPNSTWMNKKLLSHTLSWLFQVEPRAHFLVPDLPTAAAFISITFLVLHLSQLLHTEALGFLGVQTFSCTDSNWYIIFCTIIYSKILFLLDEIWILKIKINNKYQYINSIC